MDIIVDISLIRLTEPGVWFIDGVVKMKLLTPSPPPPHTCVCALLDHILRNCSGGGGGV